MGKDLGWRPRTVSELLNYCELGSDEGLGSVVGREKRNETF